jgi:hypothetical protein
MLLLNIDNSCLDYDFLKCVGKHFQLDDAEMSGYSWGAKISNEEVESQE